jgi:hypothetical protein
MSAFFCAPCKKIQVYFGKCFSPFDFAKSCRATVL